MYLDELHRGLLERERLEERRCIELGVGLQSLLDDRKVLLHSVAELDERATGVDESEKCSWNGFDSL